MLNGLFLIVCFVFMFVIYGMLIGGVLFLFLNFKQDSGGGVYKFPK